MQLFCGFFIRTLAEMDIKSTPIDTKGFQELVKLVHLLYHFPNFSKSFSFFYTTSHSVTCALI